MLGQVEADQLFVVVHHVEPFACQLPDHFILGLGCEGELAAVDDAPGADCPAPSPAAITIPAPATRNSLLFISAFLPVVLSN